MEVRERKQVENGQNATDESLKEKLKWQWQNRRDFTPKKEETSQVAVIFFFVIFFVSLFETLFVLVPTIYSEWTKWGMVVATVWLFYITLVNWHRSYFDTANVVKAEVKQKYFPDMTDTPPDWTHCFTCQVS